jgi:guanidinopropionase
MKTKTPTFRPLDSSETPRFAGEVSFMRLPVVNDPALLDIALAGIPWDGGTTNRPGARHGPRDMRAQSMLLRPYHHVSDLSPYDNCQVADIGDSPVNPIDPMDSLARIQGFFEQIHDAGAVPLSAGGDHLSTLPVLRAIARQQPVGLIHFDAHSDTNVV